MSEAEVPASSWKGLSVACTSGARPSIACTQLRALGVILFVT